MRPGTMVLTRMPSTGQVAGHRQGHTNHAALGCRVSRLADLPLVGRHRSGVDDNAATAVVIEHIVICHLLCAQAQHVKRTHQVDLDNAIEFIQREGPFLPMVRMALPVPAKLQQIWIAPNASIAAAIPACTDSSLVTLTLQNTTLPGNSSTSWLPFSSFISKMATFAPLATKRFTVARPRPDAPPVITATFLSDPYHSPE